MFWYLRYSRSNVKAAFFLTNDFDVLLLSAAGAYFCDLLRTVI